MFANGTNDNGWIVGYSTDALGFEHAVLWMPVPEPSSILALLCGIGGMGGELSGGGGELGRSDGTRTRDSRLKRAILYLLSYRPMWYAHIIPRERGRGQSVTVCRVSPGQQRGFPRASKQVGADSNPWLSPWRGLYSTCWGTDPSCCYVIRPPRRGNLQTTGGCTRPGRLQRTDRAPGGGTFKQCEGELRQKTSQ